MKFRKGTVQAIEDAAPRGGDANPLFRGVSVEGATPPYANQFVSEPTERLIFGKYDRGHRPGFEFQRMSDVAKREGWTPKQWRDFQNDPKHYRLEDPFDNRGHLHEAP